MTYFTFQQATNSDLQQPYPVVVDESGEVLYIADYGIERTLIGFTEPDTRSINLWLTDFIAEPERAIGLVPVYSGNESRSIFEIGNEVVSARVLDLG